MLLNAWLTAAKRHFRSSAVSRRSAGAAKYRRVRSEQLEARLLLTVENNTALVINAENQSLYTNANGTIDIDNADMAGKDALVIEGINVGSNSGDAISINLSGITLKRLAIESILVSSYGVTGIDIDLTNVTGLQTLAVEDVLTANLPTGRGIEITLDNTDATAVTIDDSTFPGIRVDAINGADIQWGLVTQNTINAKAGFEGVLLNVTTSSANNFRIENNFSISSPNRDFVQVNATNSPTDGLSIANNVIGTTTQGAGLIFRAEGDTFVQPFRLTNNSTTGERLQTFVFDVSSIGLQFDIDGTSGKPFTAVGGTGAATGVTSATLSADLKALTVTFNDFDPGETLQFVIDIDLEGGTAASIFGDDLIGADITGTFSGARTVAGQMIGDPNELTVSEFAVGPGVAGATHGVNLNLTNSPMTDLTITGNSLTGAPGHGILFDADSFSDVEGVISENSILGSGRDGVRLNMVDSSFTGAVINNTISNNGGYGVAVLPSLTRTGLVQAAQDLSQVVITSTNHGLQTGDQVIIQGMVNDNPNVNHPGNGRHTITRIDNNRFRLNGVNGTASGVAYVGGGAWYKPAGQANASAGKFVNIDMQATIPSGTITGASNAGPIVVTSANHGLTTGQRVRISNVRGNTAANGVHKITVLTANTFSLDGTTGNGAYDTSLGFGSWRANVITDVSNAADMVVTSPGHGLVTGDEIRISGVLGNTAANGTFKVSVLTANTFQLIGYNGNGAYAGDGHWVKLIDSTPSGDSLAQAVSGNVITGNALAGFYADLKTGTAFQGDIVRNNISLNGAIGVHIESHSYGQGIDLPLDPTNPFDLPVKEDVSFDVNIGTGSAGDSNTFDRNGLAGIAIEALDAATGSFQIRNNTITESQDDNSSATPYSGDGIVIRMERDDLPVEAVAILKESIIDGNVIGVDNLGNEGNGLYFKLAQRTRIQDLQVTNNTFLNSGLDGFHFERSEDASLNSVIFEKNRVTNNRGDGFDIFAKNTVRDRIDFLINENVITDNGQYGLRIDVQADARIAVEFNGNDVFRNGHTPAGTGFHPNDGVPGSTNAAGGVGIHAFQQVDVIFTSVDTQINDNVGDGFSVDAFHFFDTLKLVASFERVELNNNSLTGFRNHGAATGSFSFVDSTMNDNGEDGMRVVSIEDKADVYRRRVGGMDLDISSMNTQYNRNAKDGVHLGQGVSAVFGDGTIDNANYFEENGRNGFLVTQHNSPYLDNLGRRRHVQVNRAFFQFNGDNGLDIGIDPFQEGGNTEHGDEVASDIYMTVNNAVISQNGGDGVEYLGDDTFRIPRLVGGGQDVPAIFNSALSVSNSRITNNTGRGVDILNRHQQDTFVTLTNNDILSNGLEGVYVVNTASINQLQRNSADQLEVYIEPSLGATPGTPNPNIELRVQDNLIQSNGTAAAQSRVPTVFEFGNNDASGVANLDWGHATTLVAGTLGGLVIRVGTAHSSGIIRAANPDFELGRSGIDAEVWKNSFDGNFGADVYFDNFVSHMPVQSDGDFDASHDPDFAWREGYRDPLSRFDLSFRQNTGNSLDVINGFAFLDNLEDYFKSRNVEASTSPPHNHGHSDLNPNGHFSGYPSDRKRNATRTIGFFDNVGDDPSSVPMIADDGTTVLAAWSYDGMGTPTWRVESDFDFLGFSQRNPTLGFSGFFDVVTMDGLYDYQWDTGVDTPSFTGATPYSLSRGDIFNVVAGEDPIAADALENNNSFVGATNLGVVSGAGYSVNALTPTGNLNLHLKADRDYYRFKAGGSGTLTVNLNALDANGDDLTFMLYEIQPDGQTEEVAMLQNADGTTAFRTANAGGSNSITATVVRDREYVIEIMSDELENVGNAPGGKTFRYGTTRSYSLSVNAPALGAGGGGSSGGSGGGSSSGGGGGGGGGNGGGGNGDGSGGGSLPGAPSATITPVSPDPRSTAVSTVGIVFTEDVTGVDLTDFRLTRNGSPVTLSAAAGASVTQVSAYQYTLNIGTLTGESGTYVVTLVAAGSGIKDTDNLSLTGNATDTWSVVNAVTTTADTPDTAVGDGSGTDINGDVSLRSAIMEANATAGNDVIVLGAGTYLLTRSGRYEDNALDGDLDIKGNLIIRGASPRTTIIDANSLDRIFHVFPGVTLTLENLTLTGGEAHEGGAIYNDATGTIQLRNVNVYENYAYSQGGGIYNEGTIDALNVSIARNIAGTRGGGVHNRSLATFVNTTISTNSAQSRGGAIFNEDAANTSMINVTMALNYAGSRAGGLGTEVSGTTRLGNSILDRNETDETTPAVGAINVDMLGRVTSLGTNLIRVLDSRSATGASAGLVASDRFGRTATPLTVGLNPLTDTPSSGSNATNGLWYHPLQVSSNAVDRGNNSVYPTTPLLSQLDQVGRPRLIEGNADGTVTIDIGAVEYFVSVPIAIIDANPAPAGANENVNFSGLRSTHTNPSIGTIQTYQWDFNWDGVEANFGVDATGPTVVRSFTATTTVGLRVTDNFGVVAYRSIVIEIKAPKVPTILRPFPVTTDLTPVFTWDGDPSRHSLVVDNLTTGQNGVINVSNLTTTTYTPPANLPIGNYRAKVTSTNGSGSTESAFYFFEITRITLNAPITNNVYDVTPIFSWSSIGNTSRYDIWVNRNQPSFIQEIVRNQFVSGNSFEPSSSLGPGTFTWWVRAIDSDGNAGDWSLSRQFSIVRPTFTSPGSATLDTTPTFRWTNLSAPRYELWVDQVGGQSRIIHQLALTTNSFTPTTALPNGTYRAWVRALGENGEAGLWSNPITFQLDFRVGPLTFAPVGVVVNSRPRFEWQAFEGVTSYDLWVDNISTGVTQIIRVQDVPHAPTANNRIQYVPTINLLAGNYRWWVRANAENGLKSAWSTPTNFTIPVPSIITPRGSQSTNLPTFQWSGVDQFVKYELWVDNLTTGTSKVLFVSNLTSKTYTPTLPFENGTFRTWVRGFDANNNASQWSGPADFTVNATLGSAPTGLTPSGTIANNRPTFTWTPTAGAVSYEILVKNISQTGQPTVISVSGISANVVNGVVSFTTTTTLAPNQNYRWWVRGYSAAAIAGPWSQPLNFRVVSNDEFIVPAPMDPSFGELVIPVVATINVDSVYEDEVQAVTVHPAGMHVQLNPAKLIDEQPEEAAVEGQVPSGDGVDSIMELWADGLVGPEALDVISESADSAVVIPAADAAVQESAQKSDEPSAASALMAGLFAMAFGRTSRSDRRNRRS